VVEHPPQGGDDPLLPLRRALRTIPTGYRPAGQTGGSAAPPRSAAPPPAPGVVEGHDEICHGRSREAPLDEVPRRQEVGEGDDGEIVHERSAEHRSRRLHGRNAGNHHNLRRSGHLRSQLQGEPRHAVDTGVAAGDQGHGLSRGGQVQGLAAALHLLHHAGGNDLLPRDEGRDQVQVRLVPHHRVGVVEGLVGLEGHMVEVAGTDADDVEFCHL